MRRALLTLVICLLVGTGYASPRTEVTKGNGAAESGNAADALTHYKRALELRGDSSVILYDIGNLFYEQGDYKSSEQFYGGSLRPRTPQRELSETLYNLGNSLFQSQQYDKAVAAYVEALKRNPADKQAKYNLELARQMLRQQQQQRQQKNQEQEDQERKPDEDQQQKPPQQPDSTEQQQPQNQQQQNEQPPENESQPQLDRQMSKEEAERILNALLQDEQNTLKDAKKVKAVTRAKREKDW